MGYGYDAERFGPSSVDFAQGWYVQHGGLAELANDLQRAADDVVEATKRVIGQGCLNIKKDAQRIVRDASHRGYLPHYPRSIGYDVTAEGPVVTGEIGPDRNKLQGGLGHIIEYGSIHNAPIPHLTPALDAELPRTEQYLADVGAQLLEGQRVPGGAVADPEQ